MEDVSIEEKGAGAGAGLMQNSTSGGLGRGRWALGGELVSYGADPRLVVNGNTRSKSLFSLFPGQRACFDSVPRSGFQASGVLRFNSLQPVGAIPAQQMLAPSRSCSLS